MVACMPACASWFRFLSAETDCFRRLGLRISETGTRLTVLAERLAPRPYSGSHELTEDTEMGVRYVASHGQLQRSPSNTTPSTANLSFDDRGQLVSPEIEEMEC